MALLFLTVTGIFRLTRIKNFDRPPLIRRGQESACGMDSVLAVKTVNSHIGRKVQRTRFEVCLRKSRFAGILQCRAFNIDWDGMSRILSLTALDRSPVVNLPTNPFRHGIEADINENPIRTSCHASAGTKPILGDPLRRKSR